MLVLQRKVGQEIMIGDDIIIAVLSIDPIRKQVGIGIKAPQEVPIQRPDRYKNRRNENDGEKESSS